MAEFQEVRQLVAVSGVDRHLKGMGAFLGVLYRPALGIGSGAVWRCRLDLIPDGIPGLFYSGLHIIAGGISKIIQLLHDLVCQLVYLDRTHDRLAFWQRSFTALRL